MSLRQLEQNYYAVSDEIRVLREEGSDVLDPNTFAAKLIEQQVLRYRRDRARSATIAVLHATCS